MTDLNDGPFKSFTLKDEEKKSNIADPGTIPIIAVKNINKTVLNAPIFWPILIITNISTAGMPIKSINIVFICPFPNYINNVYLSNNE